MRCNNDGPCEDSHDSKASPATEVSRAGAASDNDSGVDVEGSSGRDECGSCGCDGACDDAHCHSDDLPPIKTTEQAYGKYLTPEQPNSAPSGEGCPATAKNPCEAKTYKAKTCEAKTCDVKVVCGGTGGKECTDQEKLSCGPSQADGSGGSGCGDAASEDCSAHGCSPGQPHGPADTEKAGADSSNVRPSKIPGYWFIPDDEPADELGRSSLPNKE